MHKYDDTFFNYIEQGSLRSSRSVVPLLKELLDPSSVLDVGCGRGAWLSTWKRLDVECCMGIDGDYVDSENLLIEKDSFSSLDISKSFDLSRKFSVVQCLEVAEHIDEGSADVLIGNLCSHSDVVVFSAAPPGQGGEHHVNEKPYVYWRDKFIQNGFIMFDPLRSRLKDKECVLPWYKYNIFLFVHKDSLANLSDDILSTQLDSERRIADISPALYKVRKKIISLPPVYLSTALAVVKKHLICAQLAFQASRRSL